MTQTSTSNTNWHDDIPFTPDATMTCEVCGTQVPYAQMFSPYVWYPIPGYNDTLQAGYTGYACPCGQHVTCTHEHSMLAAVACLMKHIENGQHANPQLPYSDTRLNQIHNIVASINNTPTF
jgi:hypothetical protein